MRTEDSRVRASEARPPQVLRPVTAAQRPRLRAARQVPGGNAGVAVAVRRWRPRASAGTGREGLKTRTILSLFLRDDGDGDGPRAVPRRSACYFDHFGQGHLANGRSPSSAQRAPGRPEGHEVGNDCGYRIRAPSGLRCRPPAGRGGGL